MFTCITILRWANETHPVSLLQICVHDDIKFDKILKISICSIQNFHHEKKQCLIQNPALKIFWRTLLSDIITSMLWLSVVIVLKMLKSHDVATIYCYDNTSAFNMVNCFEKAWYWPSSLGICTSTITRRVKSQSHGNLRLGRIKRIVT